MQWGGVQGVGVELHKGRGLQGRAFGGGVCGKGRGLRWEAWSDEGHRLNIQAPMGRELGPLGCGPWEGHT